METIIYKKINTILNEQKEYFGKGKTRDIDFRIQQLEILRRAIRENEKLLI